VTTILVASIRVKTDHRNDAANTRRRYGVSTIPPETAAASVKPDIRLADGRPHQNLATA